MSILGVLTMHNIEHKTIDLVILTDFGCSVEPAGNVRCYRVLRDVKRWPKVAQLQDNFRFINLNKQPSTQNCSVQLFTKNCSHSLGAHKHISNFIRQSSFLNYCCLVSVIHSDNLLPVQEIYLEALPDQPPRYKTDLSSVQNKRAFPIGSFI